jgi:hypothetical protein
VLTQARGPQQGGKAARRRTMVREENGILLLASLVNFR